MELDGEEDITFFVEFIDEFDDVKDDSSTDVILFSSYKIMKLYACAYSSIII